VLLADHRLTRPSSFRHVVKTGRRSGARTLVTHLAAADEPSGSGPRVGFVVSKAVGSAVVRNRVKRRLRHAVAARISLLPDDGALVVRALPAAAAASYQELVTDLDRCLDRSLVSRTAASTVGSGQVDR